VLSSPSGAGKTTISRLLLARDRNLTMSISVTTRPKRPGEIEGVDYHFVDPTEFNLMINRRELLEYAKVFNNYYGTPAAAVADAISSGKDVIFDIDWQGAQQISGRAREDIISIFILPPSTAELDRRLHSRAQDAEEVVASRMEKAPDEMSHYAEYDFIIVNHDIEKSVTQVEAILTAERLRRSRLIGLTDFVRRLQVGH
jgi:guanylate kinase